MTRGRPVTWSGTAKTAARVALLLVALTLALAPAASAHNTLQRSDPPNGGMVAVGRTAVTLWFWEPLAERGSSFSVRGTGRSAVAIPTKASFDDDNQVVRLSTAPLARGMYRIEWEVVADDGHPVHGAIAFGAGLRPDGTAALAADGPTPWALGLRLVDLGGMLLAVGALALAGRVLGALGTGAPVLRRQVLALGAAGAALSAAVVVVTPVLTSPVRPHAADDSVAAWAEALGEAVLGSTWGVLWLLRLAALCVALAALLRWRVNSIEGGRPRAAWFEGRRPRPREVAAVALVAAALLDAWLGHSATLPERSAITVAAAGAHVLAAGVWAGGLMALVVCALPILRLDGSERAGSARAVWRAYSPMAAAAAGILVATGLYEAGRHVGTLADLSSSTYGVAILAKVLLVAATLGAAGYSTLVVHPDMADRVLGARIAWRPQPRRLSTTVTVETTFLAIAVAVAALMTSVPTAREVGASGRASAPVHGMVDGLFVSFEAVPTGREQRLIVRTEPVVRPVVSALTRADVLMGGRTFALSEVETGRYEATATTPSTAPWTAEVVLHRSGGPDSVLPVSWRSSAGITHSQLELPATALCLLLLAGVGALTLSRRRQTHPPTIAEPDDAQVEEKAEVGER